MAYCVDSFSPDLLDITSDVAHSLEGAFCFCQFFKIATLCCGAAICLVFIPHSLVQTSHSQGLKKKLPLRCGGGWGGVGGGGSLC